MNAVAIKELYIKIRKYILDRFVLSKNIFFIGGSDTLPPPLTPEEEKEMLSKFGKSDEAKTVLIEHNLRLVVYLAKKFESTGINVEDLISIGTIGLIKAVNTFKVEKNIKLATYASKCIENEILMYLRRVGKAKTEISLDEPLNIDWDGNELLLSDILGTDEDIVFRDMENEVDLNLLNESIKKLNKREYMIMKLRFGLNNTRSFTQKEVADMLGISQSYISRLEKKILNRLKKDISKAV
ncbi:RNA polymerase sporulation-specific sigma factor [Sedimentibacter acidaminivorans]|jgi:RNA polymerase sigma-E/F/G factor|uniref:RNA polymerase sigma factor n=1 Tax=Sedimentibacter acidaminivorans TaxID=913099 RepID=A0ABS4GII5_9FIRM|nr:RNA polymerase sporulation sigma factor SigE [Sedimentibacter acidaminivorans]MBP1927407.1 RNA polymerase sporulation-specific sigma factor [Sedimentibacter acidaminivorans]